MNMDLAYHKNRDFTNKIFTFAELGSRITTGDLKTPQNKVNDGNDFPPYFVLRSKLAISLQVYKRNNLFKSNLKKNN